MVFKRIFADDHRFSAKPTPVKYSYSKSDVFLGDHHDVHCLKKHAKAMIASSDKHRHKCDMSKGVIQVRDNHNGIYGRGLPEYVIENKVIYTHHDPFYSDKDKKKWYAKEAGISKWKFFGIKITNSFRNMKGDKVSKKKLQIIAKYACSKGKETGKVVHTAAVAHLHKTHDGIVQVEFEGLIYFIRVIVVNCGVTEVELDD